ncbi:ATP-binding protein [uncultured Chryseobacterium sp.]|uniref:ATP-binding protein n=1 Tax=uncultured Chryseobacterium sp. TaxID=259322 RepID=UPI0025D48A30|nr:ATP-binding protein [uncultured Chryseobacterium sp.]
MKIRIKNFGPIKEGLLENEGWIKISKNTIFIGDQGSGKSTIAKLISTFMWIEKALTRGDFNEEWLEKKYRFRKDFLTYHRLENYISAHEETVIDYIGEAYHFKFEKDILKIVFRLNTSYQLPQIMYVPAERNFISYVRTAKELKLASDALNEFLTEFDHAKKTINNALNFPINNLLVSYDEYLDVVNLIGKDYKILLSESSSGFQSSVPLFMVSNYLSQSVKFRSGESNRMNNDQQYRFRQNVEAISKDKNLTDEQKRLAISALSAKFNKEVFFNIVEEPEQNLFPSSQLEIIKSLISINNKIPGNKLIITSHSPYLISFLGIMIEAYNLFNKAKKNENKQVLNDLDNLLTVDLLINPDQISIYEMNEEDGTLRLLPNFEGIPSDDNFLNKGLKKSNEIFDKLLELEEQL